MIKQRTQIIDDNINQMFIFFDFHRKKDTKSKMGLPGDADYPTHHIFFENGRLTTHHVFDAFGAILGCYYGLTPPDMRKKIIKCLLLFMQTNELFFAPAHWPPYPVTHFTKPWNGHRDNSTRELPGQYHNGGLWAWYMGLFVKVLLEEELINEAYQLIISIIEANSPNFPESHSLTLTTDVCEEPILNIEIITEETTPSGPPLAVSAAAQIIGIQALDL